MKLLLQLFGTLAVIIYLSSCEKELSLSADSEGLKFSVDTVAFDTIFTQMGSATKNLRIYNPYDENVTISNIRLAGGSSSKFRININGVATNSLNDIRLDGHDSLFVFVEVTIDPTLADNPLLVRDSIYVTTDSKQQQVILEAYGQNFIKFKNQHLQTITLTKDKPYLIYDTLFVDADHQVTIDKGARLYFYQKAMMQVKGSIQVNGTLDEPVLFAGSRLEHFYDKIPGQWGYIEINPSSTDSYFKYANIRNGMYGIAVDSVGIDAGEQPLILENSTIQHISNFGLYALNTKIQVGNLLVADCGKHCVTLEYGGDYQFTHCTFANYYTWATRTTPSFYFINSFKDKNGVLKVNPYTKLLIANSIIHGYNASEIGYDLKNSDGTTSTTENYLFDNCLVKVDSKINTTEVNHFKNAIVNKSPDFVNVETFNFQLLKTSVCRNVGTFNYTSLYPHDLKGIIRKTNNDSDLGVYEFFEK